VFAPTLEAFWDILCQETGWLVQKTIEDRWLLSPSVAPHIVYEGDTLLEAAKAALAKYT